MRKPNYSSLPPGSSLTRCPWAKLRACNHVSAPIRMRWHRKNLILKLSRFKLHTTAMQHLVLLIKEEDWGRLCSSCLLVIHQCHQVCLCRLRNKPHVTLSCCHGNLIILTWGLDDESEGVWRVTAPVRMWPWKYPKNWGEIHQNQKDKISAFAALPLMKWWSHL